MTAEEGAAAYFAEHEDIAKVYATSDGNVFGLDQQNRAEFHALQNELEPPELITNKDDGMPALIATAKLRLVVRDARNDATVGTSLETEPPAPVVPPTYEEARQALADALGIDELDDLQESYTKDGVELLAVDAVIATWYRSGKSVATWGGQDKNTRQTAVEAEFPDFIQL